MVSGQRLLSSPSSPNVFYQAGSPGAGIAVDATNVYFQSYYSAMKCAVGPSCSSPTSPTTLASDDYGGNIAVYGGYVYWSDFGVEQCATVGCTDGGPTRLDSDLPL